MEYRRLGRSGLQVSELSFGSWLTFGKQISDDTAEELMTKAYENGINFFDNAEAYARGQSEVVMGNILKKKGWDRSTYVVSSKVFWGGNQPNQKGLNRKHVVEACEGALKRLQVDYLDLFFCHRPDRNTPIEETVWTMHNLVQQGKILYWGTSEWSAQEIATAHAVANRYNLIPPTMEQPQYNMFTRKKVERDYDRIYEDFGLGTTIWSPLASGVLSGKYNQGMPEEETRLTMEGMEWLRDSTLKEERIEKAQQLAGVADDLGVSLPQLAIAWCLKNPQVSTVILGASKTHHLEQNLEAVSIKNQLTEDVMKRIEDILANKPEVVMF